MTLRYKTSVSVIAMIALAAPAFAQDAAVPATSDPDSETEARQDRVANRACRTCHWPSRPGSRMR